MKSLVVDDDFTNRIILQTALQSYGDVHIAANGEEAVQAVNDAIDQGKKYDLICLDIIMPGMDGHTTLECIRDLEASKGFPLGNGAIVVMTTGLSDSQSVFNAFRGQCDYYLTKPINVAKLKEFLNNNKLVA